MKEIWRPLYSCWKGINYNGNYEISNLGIVKSLERAGNSHDIIRKTTINKFGYESIGLTENYIKKQYNIHQLVMHVFIGTCLDGFEINHINGIKTDNRLENLEYCTRSENIKHKFEVLGYKNNFHLNHPKSWKGKFGKDNPKSKKVQQITIDGSYIKTWDSIRTIQRELGINQSNISRVCKGKAKTTGGFVWKYN